MNSKAYKSYEISKNEYRELKYFCLRYRKMQREVQLGSNFDMERFIKTRDCVELIDNALQVATDNEVIRDYLRKAVTTNIKFDDLGVPMGRRQFYELRRKFFYVLRELKMG